MHIAASLHVRHHVAFPTAFGHSAQCVPSAQSTRNQVNQVRQPAFNNNDNDNYNNNNSNALGLGLGLRVGMAGWLCPPGHHQACALHTQRKHT